MSEQIPGTDERCAQCHDSGLLVDASGEDWHFSVYCECPAGVEVKENYEDITDRTLRANFSAWYRGTELG